MIMKLFTEGEYDQVDIVYNAFKNAATQILTEEQFLPIQVEELARKSQPVLPMWIIFLSLPRSIS